MLPSPDQCTDQIVDGSRQRLKVSVIDPAGFDAPRQVPHCRHPIARHRRPSNRLDLNVSGVMLHDFHRLDSLDVALDDLDRRETVSRGPAALGCPCPTRRRTPLRHPAADLNNDRTAAPTTLEDLARRTGGPTSHRPVACRLASRFHGPHYITAK